MPYNGAGLFTPVYNWESDATNGILVRADRMDGQDIDIASGLSNCVTKDGQQTITANIPMGGFKLTGLGAASSAQDSVRAVDVQNNTLTYFADSGSANAYAITPVPAVAAYATGQSWTIKIANANTSASTLAVSGLATKAITKNGSNALTGGELAAGGIYEMTYDGTEFVIVGPSAGALGLTNGGYKNANFNISPNTFYFVKANSLTRTATFPAKSAANNQTMCALFVQGANGVNLTGTINGLSQTLFFQGNQSYFLGYSATTGWC